MLAKLIIIVITIGATACGVLVIRQERIDVAHDMAQIHRRIQEKDQQLWDLRVQIHNRLNNESIRSMIERFEAQQGGPLVPLNFDVGLQVVSTSPAPAYGPRLNVDAGDSETSGLATDDPARSTADPATPGAIARNATSHDDDGR